MKGYNLTSQDFIMALKEQLYFLNASISDFSNNEIEAKRAAATIRILVHDTNNSTSLLKSLDDKELKGYINSASPNDGRLHSMSGMIGVRGSNPNQYVGLVSKVNIKGRLGAVPLFQQHLPEWHKGYSILSFDDWWTMEVIKINNVALSRKDLVLNLANKDGGAHIDELLPEGYYEAKTSKLKLNINGTETEFEKSIVYASVIQIAWELVKSIEKGELNNI